MDEPVAAAEAAIPGPHHPRAEPEAAAPSTSQAQPSVPPGYRNPFAPSVPHQTVFAVTLSNAKSSAPDDETKADCFRQDVS